MNVPRERLLQELPKLSPLLAEMKVSGFFGGREKLESVMLELKRSMYSPCVEDPGTCADQGAATRPQEL